MAERYEDQYRDRGRRDDRGFMERAGDELRSWFGDEEAERRREMDDREREREGYRDQLYGQSSERPRQYGSREYGNRGYGDRGDRSYTDRDRGFSDRGYGYGAGAGERSWGQESYRGQENYRGQEGYRGGQSYGGGDRSRYGRGGQYATGFRGAGEGYGTSSASSGGYGGYGGYGSGYRSDYGRGSGSGFATGSFAGAGERETGSYGGRFGVGDDRGMNYSGRGPKGYQRSDDRINEDVCDRLCDAPDIDASNIEVKVSGAEVTLTGTVDDREAKRRAEDLVESISGVREVHNNLRVTRGQDAGWSGGTATSAGSAGAGTTDVAHPGITGGGPSGATNVSTAGSPAGGAAAGVPENPLGLRENTDTKTSTAGGRR